MPTTGTTGGMRTHGRHFATGMAVCVTSEVSTSRGIARRASVRNPICRRRLTFRSPVDDDHTTFPAGAETVAFIVRPFSLDEVPQHLVRLRRWGLMFGTSFLLFVPIHTRNSALQSPFSHHLGGCQIRRSVRSVFSTRVPHIVAYTIYLTSAQYFP